MRPLALRLPYAPLAALFSLAVLAIAWTASSRVCMRPVAMAGMPMPAMATAMPAAAPGTVMMCPVVLGLIAVSTVLAAFALIVASRDRHRRLTAAVLARSLARLPVWPAFAAIAAAGSASIAAIVAVDGGTSFSPALCLTLAAIVAGIACGAVLCATSLARLALALCERLFLALIAAIGDRAASPVLAALGRPAPLAPVVFAAAFGRGMRAPPLLVP